jgi:hypothetical protein
MTGRGRGASNGRRSGRSHGRGHNYTGTRTAAKSGLCAALGNNVFDYGHRAAVDQMSENFMGKASTVRGYKLWAGHKQ